MVCVSVSVFLVELKCWVSSLAQLQMHRFLESCRLLRCKPVARPVMESVIHQEARGGRQTDEELPACSTSVAFMIITPSKINEKKEKSTTSAVRTSNALLSPCFHLNHFVSVSTMVRNYTEGLHTTGRGQSNKKIQIFLLADFYCKHQIKCKKFVKVTDFLLGGLE